MYSGGPSGWVDRKNIKMNIHDAARKIQGLRKVMVARKKFKFLL